MRILLVGDYPRDARLGSTKVMVKLQDEFRALSHTCDLLLGDEFRYLPSHRLVRWALSPIAAYAAVRRVFRERGRYDVVDVASAEGLWIGVLRRLGLFGGAAVIARSHGIEHLNYQRMLDDHAAGILHKPWTRRWWYPVTRLSQVAAAARVADRLIVLTDADRDFVLARGWKREQDVDIIPHGVSTRFLDDVPPADEPRGGGILFCGSWDAMKGVHYLADAFGRLVASGRRVNLTILGGGVAADVIRASFPEQARSHVTIVDRAPEETVITAYRRHDVLAFPSSYEGFGMVLLEAMTQRLPVVATPAGCGATLVEDGRTGLSVPARDAGALAAALGRMLDDSSLRARLADAAFCRVLDMTWGRTAAATLDVYQHALAARQTAFAHA